MDEAPFQNAPVASHARRDRLNLLSQILIKGISIPYGLIVIALATRQLPPADSYLLLQAASLMTLPGLLQLGMGYLILREVSNAWARDGHLPDLPVVRTAFLVILVVTTLALIAAVIACAAGTLPPALLPIVCVSFIGQWAIVADYVRLARGQVLKTNLLIFAGIALCAAIVWWGLARPVPSSAAVIFGGLAAPFLASIASFALLLTDREFRELLSFRGLRRFGPLIRQATPMLLNTLGFSLMLVIPLGAPVVPWYPELAFGSLACLRLTASVIYLYYFALQPIGPIFLRSWYGASSDMLARTSGRLMTALLAICIVSGAGFALAGPAFIDLWLHGVTVDARRAVEWGAIITLALIVMTTVYFCQNTSRPVTAASCLIVIDLVMLLAPLAGLSIEAGVILSLAIGAAIGGIALTQAIREQMAKLPRSPAV